MNYPIQLGLNKEQLRILRTLERNGALSVSEIAERCKLPRTSLYTPLKDLRIRTLVTSQKIGKEHMIMLRDPLSPARDKNRVTIQHVKGKKDFIKIYSGFSHVPNTRIKWIQPSGVLKEIFKVFSVAEVTKINNLIRRAGSIIEIIVEKNYYTQYKYLVKDSDFIKLINTLHGRPYDFSFIENGILDPNVEIILFPKYFVVLNWKTLSGYKGSDKTLYEFFERYFNIIKSMASKTDVSTLLQKYTEISDKIM